ncbi:MAG TPA: Uma2 family endonuclease [Bryobacteraceae bacterium]|jgi:Uma2 family endonuclease|nr:Uma2 family endonuclease [Bryobacteraceae bacterium]
MPSTATRVTPEEYLERERQAETRSEYRNGEIVAMAGASFAHAQIVSNLHFRIRIGLGNRSCGLFTTDLRLAVRAANVFTYPDVMVICGQPALADDRRDIVLNPVVLIEVLSKSTHDYDRGEKFASYRSIPSLMEYLTVAQDKVHIERHTRQPNEPWSLSEFTDPQAVIALSSIDVELRVADLYEKVDLASV